MIHIMKNNIFTIFIMTILLQVGYAQENKNRIYGNVFDKSTGEPIEDVNVYLSNTTWGSSTNKEGYYRILQIPQGIHELVVMIVGYKYETKNILVKKDSELKFDFYLTPIIYETEATLVEGTIPTEWLEDLNFFKHFFIGSTDFARNCIIENEEVLDFTKPNRRLFQATASRPLIIINKALGYRIDCVLINFSHSRSPERWRWSIKPKFTELKSENNDESIQWQENRQEAYLGSLYHFLRSFMNKRLWEENFDIYSVARAGVRIRRQDWRTTIVNYDAFIKPGILPSEKKLKFDNFLYVVYNKKYVSWIGLNYTDITLDEYGYPEEGNPYEVFGQWALNGVADLLPKNYELD